MIVLCCGMARDAKRDRGSEILADHVNYSRSRKEHNSADRLRTARRGGEVEVEFLFGGVADECPVVDEPAAVAVAEVVEDDAAGGAEAGWHFEQVDEFLGREAAGEVFGEDASGGLEDALVSWAGCLCDACDSLGNLLAAGVGEDRLE